MTELAASAGDQPVARDRILEAAYDLFTRRGIRDVGVNELIERARVTKATLYNHFPSKDDLVLAFLELRERRWSIEWLEAEARRRGSTPEARLLAIFELLDEWFGREGFEGCAFINTLLEMRTGHPAGRASITHLANIRAMIVGLADEAKLRDPEFFAAAFHMLVKGATVSAAEGDREAARTAREVAVLLLARHRPISRSRSARRASAPLKQRT
jgi:AcrR family transcriptional regulator